MRIAAVLLVALLAGAWPAAHAAAGACPPAPALARCRAELGDVRSQLYLGLNAYWVGTKTGDFAPAIHWLTRAARGGSVPAMRLLGELYELRLGPPFDRGAARQWYRRAAQAGDEAARLALERLSGE